MRLPYPSFGEYLPDQTSFENPGLVQATNVLPLANSYVPWPSQQPYSDPIDARARGGIQARSAVGTTYMFVGDAAKLYSLTGVTWNDVSKGGGYAVPPEDNWEFIKWGERVIAVNGADGAATSNPQVIDLGAANFADLAGTPPQARHIAAVRDQVVMGNTWDGTDGNVPNRVRWSGVNDHTSWAVSPATQAGFQDLQGDGGWIQRVVGGEYGIIFQERSVWRMTYVGSPVVYQMDEVLPGRGTPCPGSVVRVGKFTFFLSQEGFEVLRDGTASEPIGAQKVDRSFFRDFDSNYTHRVTGTFDPIARRVYWAYPGPGNVDGRPNRMLCFDWTTNRWTVSSQESEAMFVAATAGFTLEALDTISTSLDDLPESLDSRTYMGGAAQIGVMDSLNRLAFWSGPPLDATIETGDGRLIENSRTRLKEIRPEVEGGSVTVEIGTRNSLVSDPVVWSPPAAPNSRGRITRTSNARYHRFRVNIQGDWRHAMGLELQGSRGGTR